MKEPMNDLERAFAAAARGLEGRPEFFRRLRESQLCSLTVGRPAGQTTFTAGSGGDLNFQVWAKKKEACIPVFTSIERAEEALKRTGRPFDRQNALQMKGEKLFQIIAARKPARAVIINPSCAIGEMFFDTTAVKLLADGSIINPSKDGKRESGLAHVIGPADYPPNLIEPLLRYLRRCADVKAAWLFKHQPESPKATYIVGLLMSDESRARRIEQDLIVVAKGVRPVVNCSATVLNMREPAAAKIIAKNEPFYSVPDFKEEQDVIRKGVAISNVLTRVIAFVWNPIARVVQWSSRRNSGNK
jgi:hypothetical protein